MYDHVTLEFDGRIAILTLNRPKALNELNQATRRDIDAVLDVLESEKNEDVLIIIGAGPKAFVAGADISEMHTMKDV